ncbi:MAG: AI-2E family transporter [Paracoccus sp. (in: a-proteobacteria)]|nr:AI-2E family transporter [Paracoccus sp. (in: a-proteobacteria)]
MPRFQDYRTEHRFPRAAETGTPARPIPVWPIIGIFLILLFYFITSASAFLMPVSLAALLFFVFAPFRRFMGRFGVNAGASAAIVTLGMVILVGGLGYFVSGPISDIAADSQRITERLEERFQALRENIRPLEEAAARIEEVTSGNDTASTELPAPTAPTQTPLGAPAPRGMAPDSMTVTAAAQPVESGQPQELKVRVDSGRGSALLTVIQSGPSVVGQIIFTLFLLFFLLASGDMLYLKVVQSFDSLRDKRAAYMAMREIETALGSYLGAITIINAGLGICVGLTMWIWGMPQPLLWGLAAFILNFIPYLGSVSGVVACFLVGLVSFDNLTTPLLAAASYLALTALEGQLITPYFVSRRLQLNTVVVFITVALWAWFWSVLGMVVAVPILVVMKVLADHIPGLEKFGNFLAGDPPPTLEAAEAEAPDPASPRESA